MMDKDKTVKAVFVEDGNDNTWNTLNREAITGYYPYYLTGAVIQDLAGETLTEGRILIYYTTDYKFGKMRIIDTNYSSGSGDQWGLVFEFVTYDDDGSVKISREEVGLKGSCTYNLDSANFIDDRNTDFWLRIISSATGEREFTPQNGAGFYLLP